MAREKSSTFNPETDPHTRHVKAGNADIFVVNQDAIIKEIHNNTYSDVFVFDDRDFDTGLISSTLTVYEDEKEKWIYDGGATYNKSYKPEANVFFDYLEHADDAYNDERGYYYLENFYFGNTRLLVGKHSGSLAQVGVYESKIKYRNSISGKSSVHPEITVGLNAPTLDSLNREPIPQMIDHLRGYVFCVNSLSMILFNRPAITRLVVTPDGPLYNTETRGATKLKTSEPQKTIETIPKEKSEEKKLLMLDDIGGLDDIRRQLKHVVTSFKNPGIMEKWNARRPQGIFLHGPAGTGKTSLARALANEIEGELWEIKSSEIYNKWYGNSEKNMEEIFKQARAKKEPTVMLWDEFEAIVGSTDNDGGAGRVDNRVVGIFKKEMNDLRENNPNIIVVATTNYPDRIDGTMIRAGRFDVKLYVPLPNDQSRSVIFANNIMEHVETLGTESFVPFDVTELNIPELVDATDEMSGADIVEIIRSAVFTKAMEETITQNSEPISQQELLQAVRNHKRS